MSPKRPTHISDWAVTCLESLAREGLGAVLSLGGALGLMHYLDYRDTHDIDAWWTPGASGAEKTRLLAVVERCLASHGHVERRA